MKTTYFTYILQCNDGTKYYGHTNKLAERLKDHRNGSISFTKDKQPELVYYEEFNSCSEAFKREMQFKNGQKFTVSKMEEDPEVFYAQI